MKPEFINRNFLILLLTVFITIILWQFQTGRYIIYPFTIIGTWFHEIGHGITAIIFGANFEKLELYPDGSGIAYHSGNLFFGNFGRAIVAAGGPVFPILMGSVLIVASIKFKSSNIILFGFGLLMFVTVTMWVRTFFGIVSISLIAGVLLIISFRAGKNVCLFILQLLGIEACVSFYLNLGYYFSSGGVIEGKAYHSDTQVIANNLFLPYWFWGGLIVILSIFVIIFILKIIIKNNSTKEELTTQLT